MKFKEWLYFEGKAMNVSEDMIRFAKEVLEKLNKKDWKFKEVLNQRIVKSKYGEKEVKVIAYPSNKDASGDAQHNTGVIRLFLPDKQNPEYVPISWEKSEDGLPKIKSHGTVGIDPTTPDYNADFSSYYYTVIHELVHIFDIKLSKNPEWMRKYNNMNRTMDDYYTSPHEQDAHMAHRARSIVDYYLDYYKGDKKRVQQELSKPPQLWEPWAADGEPETTWRKNPKIWRKYLNTLYNVLNEK